MKVQELKSCLKNVLNNVLVYKREDNNPVLIAATEKLQATESDANVTDDEFTKIQEHFDEVSELWFTASNNIDDYAEMLFQEFNKTNGKKSYLDTNKLLKTLDSFEHSETKHLLVLAIKYYGLLREINSVAEQKIPFIKNKKKDPSLADLAKNISITKNPKTSRRFHLCEKEELTMNELYKVSRTLDRHTLKPLKAN